MNLASGLILGIIYVAAPGPIGVETVRQGIKGGFISGLAVQAGSVIGLAVYALPALLGAGLLLPGKGWRLVVGAGGMIVLLYLGVTTIRHGRHLIIPNGERLRGEASMRHAFGTGVILSLANPLELIFWLSLGSRVQEQGANGVIFLGAFFTGCIVTSLAVVFFASFWRAYLTPKAALALSWVCGLALIAFGLRLGFSVGRHFMIQ